MLAKQLTELRNILENSNRPRLGNKEKLKKNAKIFEKQIANMYL